MRHPGKKTLSLVVAAILVLGGGGVLWLAGALPGVPSPTKATMDAVADTTGAGDDAKTAEKAKSKGRKDKDAEKTKPVPVELARVGARSISAYYRAASVIEADRLVDLVARVQGRVRRVAVEEGSWVQSGQLLAELENDRERIQLEKAELTVADKARQLERSRSMLDQELISRQEFDDLESIWRLAVAERDLAAIALEDTRLLAPFAGLVTERRIVAGQQLAAGFSAFSVGDFEPLRVRVHLPEDVARKVTAGQRVLVAPEGQELEMEGTVERISPVVDPATSTVRLTLLLADAVSTLRVGGFVKVRITTDQHRDALAIPKLALVEEGALRSVFVAEADTARKVEIETGIYDESHVEVLTGLAEGACVVTMGQGGLRTGAPIRALNAEAVGYVGAGKPVTGGATSAAGTASDLARAE